MGKEDLNFTTYIRTQSTDYPPYLDDDGQVFELRTLHTHRSYLTKQDV